MMVSCLSGCNKKKEEVVVNNDIKQVKDILISAIDETKNCDSFIINNSGNYIIKARMTSVGYQFDTTTTDNYSSCSKYVKGIGLLVNCDSEYNVQIDAVMDKRSDTQIVKSNLVSFYDEPTDMFYYSLDNDTSMWFKTTYSLDDAFNEFYDVIRDVDVQYTMETKGNETKISCDLKNLLNSDKMKDYLKKHEEYIGSITAFMSALTYTESGFVTIHIDDTNKIVELDFDKLSVGNDNLDYLMENSDDMMMSNGSLTGDFVIKFTDYNKLTSDDVLLYQDKMINAVERNNNENMDSVLGKEDNTESTETDALESVVICGEDGAVDNNNVDSYDITTLSIKSMNSFGLSSENKTPFLVSIFKNDGWVFDSNENEYFRFTNEKYPDSKLFIWSATENGINYDEFDESSVKGFILDVSDSIINNTVYPDFKFTSLSVPFGVSGKFILDRYGKPDTAIVYRDYDVYQYVMYEYEGITREKMTLFTVSFKIYHTDKLDGMYGIEMQLYEGE